MSFWTDKQGNKLTFKQFMSRWKRGIEGITPLGKVKSQIQGTRIMLLGLILGLVMSLISYKNFWWVAIILIGGLINTGIQYLGLVQQKILLENIDKQMNQINDINEIAIGVKQ